MSNLELLAPAGSHAALKAAIVNGADAIYLGLNSFSARSKAENFTIESLLSAIEYAHLFDVKVYLAMNTLIKNEELTSAASLVSNAVGLGIDAVIVQDLGLAAILQKENKNIILHASTQMGIHNYEGASILEKAGFKRVILSRETTLGDIKKIKEHTNLEIEFFVQGALCAAFSGNCYFSGIVSGYSGNRGKCLQLCRKKYSIKLNNKSENGYYLSPCDISLINKLSALTSAGVTSFKIEGRMRRAEYVAESTAVYRKAIDGLKRNDVQSHFIGQADTDRLKLMFNRGNYCEAYINNPTPDLIYPYIQGHLGLKIGRVKSVINNKAILDISRKLSKGDGIKFIRNSIETGTSFVNENGNNVSFTGNIAVDDEVYITNDIETNKEITNRKRKLKVNINLKLKKQQKAELNLIYNNIDFTVLSESDVENAINSEIEKGRLEEIFNSDSDEFIEVNNLIIESDNNIFIRIAQLKAMKRKAFAELKQAILNNYKQKNQKNMQITLNKYTMSDIILQNCMFMELDNSKKIIFTQIDTLNQLSQDILEKSDYIILNPKIYERNLIDNFYEITKNKAIVNLPNICRNNDIEILKKILQSKIENYIVNNLYGIELCKNRKIIFGYMMNQLNDIIKCVKINSIEDNRISSNNINYVFGKIPLMTFSYCSKKILNKKCEKNCNGFENAAITDEMKNQFKLRHYKAGLCYMQLLNNVPLYSADKINTANNKILIDLTDYNINDSNKLFNNIINNVPLEHINFTRGYIGKKLR